MSIALERIRRGATVAISAALACAGGCYEAPGPPGEGQALELTIAPLVGVAADGASTVVVTLELDPLTPESAAITLETTSGVLDHDADPASAEARTLHVKNPGTGRIERVMRVGTRPEQALVTARVGDFHVTRTLFLEPSPPEVIALSASPQVAPADGISPIEVRARLFTSATERLVSQGARIRLRACCAEPVALLPESCDTSGLLTLPALAELTEGQEITAQAVPQRIEGGAPRRLVIVAEAWEDGVADIDCAGDAGAVRHEVALTLTPVADGP